MSQREKAGKEDVQLKKEAEINNRFTDGRRGPSFRRDQVHVVFPLFRRRTVKEFVNLCPNGNLNRRVLVHTHVLLTSVYRCVFEHVLQVSSS